jgi:tetratricopeptide (TPR) repeat protein
MNFEQNAVLPRRFVTSFLPWLAGLGALLVYLWTLNHGATFGSIGIVSNISGWSWQPALQQPVLYLVLYPFRFLPPPSVPIVLNVFNAILAALVLVLLARSIALLPHDRTYDQRELENDENSLFSSKLSWLPPVLAVMGLGLQISFWENATSITGEMIDLLIVAYVIRCLLEFRIDERQSWLSRAAFLYAAGMTNNWALIGLAPVFLAAIIWIKGLGFFNIGFIGRMALWGFAGLLLYLVLPAIQSMAAIAPIDFWSGLKVTFKSQKDTLGGVYWFLKDNYRFLVLASTSLLPLFVIALRWSSSFGDNSPLGILISKGVFHIVHALFLGACVVVLLSPPWSPRQLLPGMPFLTHYYLGALVVGYCAGYFLLICSPVFRARFRGHVLLKWAQYGGWWAVVLMLGILPVALVNRNLDQIRLTNSRLLDDFTQRLERGLPPGPCLILSDNGAWLSLLRVRLQDSHQDEGRVFYDTASAKFTDYHEFQVRQQPGLWPTNFTSLTNRGIIPPQFLIGLLAQLAVKTPACYLHPSFGYYFEQFASEPNGITYNITRYPANVLLQPPLSAAVVQTNEQFWADFDNEVLPTLAKCLPSDIKPPMPAWKKKLYSQLHLEEERNLTAEALARIYSKDSTWWAVEMQKLGRWDEAAKHLERALALNPNNIVAQVNLDFNSSHRKGEPAPTALSESVEDRFGKYQNWDQIIGDCGMFDDPLFTFEQARTFLSGRQYRQALGQLERVSQIQPRGLIPHIWLADLYSVLGQPARALDIVQRIRADAAGFGLAPTNVPELYRVEATALFRSGKKDEGQAAIAKALELAPANEQLRSVASQIYLQNGLYPQALELLERMVAADKANVIALANRGFVCLQLNRLDEARESLTSALELDPANAIVRLNRAITLFRARLFDDALADYNILLKEHPDAYQIYYGLGEIAAGKSDTATATGHFEQYLKIAPPGTPEYLQVSNRLVELKAGK